jgi:hypothetical protein
MKLRRTLWAILAVLLALAVTPARATDSHDYAKGEYAIIRDGLAPDKLKSLASHGDGEGGSENFHVWLMAEPAHRRIVALADIGSSNNLDTGPGAYYAFWSADSRRVAVTFRSNRHVVELNLYHVEGRRALPILGPSLFRDATSRDPGREDDMRRSVPEFAWKSPRRFVLKERRLFVTSDPGFVRMVGAYGRVTDKLDDGRFFVEFSAEADCVLMPDNRYRIVDLRVGKFGE